MWLKALLTSALLAPRLVVGWAGLTLLGARRRLLSIGHRGCAAQTVDAPVQGAGVALPCGPADRRPGLLAGAVAGASCVVRAPPPCSRTRCPK